MISPAFSRGVEMPRGLIARSLGPHVLTIRQNITEIFEANRRCYGYRRLQASLVKQCVIIS